MVTEPVAVVGMAVLFPGARDLDAYWRNLAEGVDCVTGIPADYDLPFPGGRGGFLAELATVDTIGMGVMPAALPHTEPDQLIALHVAQAALADAGGPPADPERVGVILGRGGYITAGLARIDLRVRVAHQLLVSLRELFPEVDDAALDRVRERFAAELGPPSRGAEIGLVPNLAASRVANRLGFGGPAYTVDAACASSLIAVQQAVGELVDGRCDVVLAGGVHHGHDVTLWSVFDRLGALSRGGRIRPFDRDADGLVIGEGTGVVVLKRLADAHRAGDRVYAVIRGTGVASDSGGTTLMHPDSRGQVLAVRRAWAAAGLDPAAPDSLGLLEAHGTATPAGDAAELATLREVFGPGAPAVIGSVKSMIGHTMPAAGIAGLIKAALAVHHGVLPPTLHCATPHPDLAATRFRPLARARPWTGPRRAAVNAFGFGGISAHVVLEQDTSPSAAPVPPVLVREPVRVLRLAADTPDDLADLLDSGSSQGNGRCRIAVVEPTERKLATARRALAAGQPWRGGDVWFSPRPLLPEHRIAFVYPGLEADFAPQVSDVAARFGVPAPDLTADTLARHGTALVAVSRLLDTALRAQGVRPDVLAGHSVGEWTAMVTSGMYDATQLDAVLAAFDLDGFRVPDLVFATVGASADWLAPRLRGEVTLTHDNSPNQCVVCGPAEHVRALLTELLDERVLGQELPFRSGFHTPRLRPYLDQIRADSDELTLRPPAVPVWSATTVAPYPDDVDEVRALFYRHLLEPVRFRPLVERLYDNGVRVFVQVGPGQVAGLIGDVLRDRDHLAVAASSPRRGGLAQLARVLAAVWAEGGAVDTDLITALPAGRSVRLDLGGKIVSLGAEAPRLLGVGAARVVAEPVRDLLRHTENATLAVLAAARATTPTRTTHEMSLRALPYLRDHRFFEVPPDWPDQYDGFPVVPATELLRQLVVAAERTAHGQVVVRVREARFQRWMAVEPAVRVEVEVTPIDGGLEVVAHGYARAVVEVAPGYSAPPAAWPVPAPERTPLLTGRQMYERRWMFHGPGYQGVSVIEGISDRHVRGVLTVPAAPGALLDSAGQLVGYWTLEQYDRDCRTVPVRFADLRFSGPAPVPGDEVTCLAVVESVTGTSVTARLQLVRADGTVWAQADEWELRRFSSDERVIGLEREGGTALLGEPHGDWVVVRERWSDLASRELIARNYLTRQEWEDYTAVPPRAKRDWLLGRIALKDAVRARLLAERPQVFPAEITTGETEDGPWVLGRHGFTLPDLDVAVASADGVAVALTRLRTATGVGIALGATPAAAAVAAVERAERAAAGNPLVSVDGPDRLLVKGNTGSWTVRTEVLPHLDVVVAWTEERS
ncbi:beta-ketoacyl synthase N-terminal-like domain-containing protein [Actinokineospora sp. NBRC 105648]|uniref:beta-ketoacyl synthase N-terminal-like domain-containing protein n=1 Tax=Actinokineospora sp. NBRC 105648 TaxID=3032206 RepID=UPI0024A21613|nr:beta-ketoacyl synthase N-terminal-like domain-containing protein [Actinokineospora sp. NBRC 105648]GLZ40427.1 polyketide synthase [Actinokineospora sp. NBRC 105648]